MYAKIMTAIAVLVIAGGLSVSQAQATFNICNLFPWLPQCQPKETPSPTPSPSPTPNSCEQEYKLKTIVYDEDPCEEPEDQCPEEGYQPTGPCEQPEATPEARVGTGGNVTTPQCPDGSTQKVAANPQVARTGDHAEVSWFRTDGDNAAIFFKEVNATDWQHSVFDIKTTGFKDDYIKHTINDLDPALGYTFGIAQRNGCGGGATTLAVVVDGPETQVFYLSYYEAGK